MQGFPAAGRRRLLTASLGGLRPIYRRLAAHGTAMDRESGQERRAVRLAPQWMIRVKSGQLLPLASNIL